MIAAPGPAQGDELVDVVDDDDRVVRTATRAEVRAGNLTHRGVAILVRDRDERLYVHRRTPTKDVFGSAYDMFVGGMVGAGETYEDAAARELAEELGVVGAPLRGLFRHRYRGPDNDWHGHVFEVRWDGAVRHQASEIEWGAWMTLDELLVALPTWDVVPDGLEIFSRWLREAGDGDARG